MHLHLGYLSVLFLAPDYPNSEVWLPGKKAFSLSLPSKSLSSCLGKLQSAMKETKSTRDVLSGYLM